ncbi:DUF499 domain-containing protein [Candidatus Bathyarchaeota archaeon]|nr:DUF499 domain-containing protein [Candidatus Bathyarchaeota archaeon]
MNKTGVKDHVKPWEDLFDPSLDEALAPALYEVYFKEGARIYVEPEEFFRRTYFSSSMTRILTSIADVLEGKGGRNIYPLFSLYGGGKTHTLITIYHAVKNPEALIPKKRDLAERLIKLKDQIRLAVLDCESDRLVPSPLKPLDLKIRKIQTIWGALADQLGRYDYLRSEDEAIVAPRSEALKKLLEDAPTVILIDEVAKYAASFLRSGNRRLQNYGNAIISFIESLAKAVQGTRSVLLVTLPIEIKEEGERRGQRTLYEPSLEDVLPAFRRGIQRVTATYDRPLTVEDVVKVLKDRIFQDIDPHIGATVGNRYISTYSSEREIFQERGIREGSRIADYYPFHPAYIETLYDLVTRVRELERTRDAIKLTRKVVRRLWNARENPDLIMPWHIDPTVEEVGNLLITSSFKDFQVVLERDLKERIRNASKPNLAKAIATSIFLKTYTYGVTVKAERVFPTKEDVAFLVYEETLLEKENARTVDIPDILDELYKATLLYLQEQDGRYWFSPFLNVIELVEERAARIDDQEALAKVKEYAEELLTKVPDEVHRRRGRRPRVRREPPHTLNPAYSQVFETFDYPSVDEQSYSLAVYLKPLKEEEILEALYNLSPGKQRTYRNTICLLYPEQERSMRMLINFAKRLIACDTIAGELKEYFSEEMQPVASVKLANHKDTTLDKLLRNILAVLNQVAYPIFDMQTNREHYGVSRAKTASLSLIRVVEDTLIERDVGKIVRDLDFERLNYMLKERLGIDLSEGDRAIPVSELISYFYTNPRLPFIKPEVVKDALEDGVVRLDIGIQKGETLFWKKVYQEGEEIPLMETGKTPPGIEDTDIILPWRIALQKFLEDKKEEKVVADLTGKKRIWYIAKIEGEENRLSGLLERGGYEEIIKLHPVIRREIEILEDFDVILSEDSITEKPEAPIEIDVEVKPIGEFKETVKLSANYGRIQPNHGTPPFKAKWILTAPPEPGTYTYGLTATVEGARPRKVERTLSLTVKPEVGWEWTNVLSDKLGYEIEEVQVEDYDSFSRVIAVLGDAWVAEGETNIQSEESAIKLEFTNVEPAVVSQLIRDSSDYLGLLYVRPLAFSTLLKLRKPVKIGNREIAHLEGLKKTRYKVRKG